MEKVFIGKTSKSNEFDDDIPHLCILRFKDAAIQQLSVGKSILKYLGRIGADEIKLSPMCSIEWRDHLTEKEVEDIQSGLFSTNIEESQLECHIDEDIAEDSDRASAIRGEAIHIADSGAYLSAYNKYSETIIEVRDIQIDNWIGKQIPAIASDLPILPAFSHRVEEVAQ